MTTPDTLFVAALVGGVCGAAESLLPTIEARASGPDAVYALDTQGIEQVLFSCALSLSDEGRVSCLAYDHADLPDTAHHALARAQALGPAEIAAAHLCSAIAAISPVLLDQALTLSLCRMEGTTRWTLEDDDGVVFQRSQALPFVDGVHRLVRATAGIPQGKRLSTRSPTKA